MHERLPQVAVHLRGLDAGGARGTTEGAAAVDHERLTGDVARPSLTPQIASTTSPPWPPADVRPCPAPILGLVSGRVLESAAPGLAATACRCTFDHQRLARRTPWARSTDRRPLDLQYVPEGGSRRSVSQSPHEFRRRRPSGPASRGPPRCSPDALYRLKSVTAPIG